MEGLSIDPLDQDLQKALVEVKQHLVDSRPSSPAPPQAAAPSSKRYPTLLAIFLLKRILSQYPSLSPTQCNAFMLKPIQPSSYFECRCYKTYLQILEVICCQGMSKSNYPQQRFISVM